MQPAHFNALQFVLSRKYLRSLPEFSYIPFGAGLHVCAGRYLAKAEVRIKVVPTVV